MTTPPLVRALLAALATGFPAGAAATLLWGDSGGTATAWLALSAAGLTGAGCGAWLSWRCWRGTGALAVAAPLLGLLGAAVPLGLLLGRAGWRALGDLLAGALPWPAMLALFPIACVAGLIVPFVLAAGRGQTRPIGRPAGLGLVVLLGLAVGAGFVVGLGDKLTPCNLALDVTLGAAALGLVCATGSGGRRFETWLSALALGAILVLPVSRIVDDRTRAWLPLSAAATAPVPIPAGPAAP